ncbi:hypothetical protein E4T66_18715 [Sinimarinibacterium sp. CAU 1509]|uniref:PepSY-associated TM helix domain-containing protein n=1 Tax=Sinimarinibacterium sp. CAU 1509 TaxID=2562283 RepID=UPI0010AD618F|nr:PepSY-associated TM helix domain-containing protein [Sinimarinibacterium sp. CAU 1509]TJY56600.1 hypothetical protein E4T66_18715 [Sinimarinibacterium sp. CAU 1509]
MTPARSAQTVVDSSARANGAQRRAAWSRTLRQWHGISSAVCLAAMLLFSLTGITLNHAAQISSRPAVTTLTATLPDAVLRSVRAAADEQGALPPALRHWMDAQWSLRIGLRPAEWSDDEVYLSLPRPGGDAWLSVTLDHGRIEYERTDRGWIAYFNDLHKGRNTGAAWGWFIDVFAVACVIFSLSGLLLLKLHAAQRGATWPMVGLGVVAPLLLAIVFIH